MRYLIVSGTPSYSESQSGHEHPALARWKYSECLSCTRTTLMVLFDFGLSLYIRKVLKIP